MCIKCVTKKFRKVPDVYFYDAQKLLVKILGNIAADPGNAKFRSINTSGKTFQTLKVDGAMEIFQYIGFVEKDGFLVLPSEVSLQNLTETLDHLLNILDLRRAEQEVEANKSAAQRKKEKDEAEELLKARFAADRKESAQRPVVASVSNLTPFSGQPKLGFKDIGVDLNAKGG